MRSTLGFLASQITPRFFSAAKISSTSSSSFSRDLKTSESWQPRLCGSRGVNMLTASFSSWSIRRSR